MNDVNLWDPRAWFAKAKRDLDTAVRLTDAPDPYLDTAIYHRQQAGEKMVKGFLVFHSQPIEKTHDIRLLAMQATGIDPQFEDWKEVVALLTPYATEFRYPDGPFEPARDEFDEALKAATELYTFVLSLLPNEVHP